MLAAIVTSPGGISLWSLAGSCGFDESTVKRRIAVMREEYGAPIVGTRDGYYWRPSPTNRRRADALIVTFCEPIK